MKLYIQSFSFQEGTFATRRVIHSCTAIAYYEEPRIEKRLGEILHKAQVSTCKESQVKKRLGLATPPRSAETNTVN